MKHCLGMFAALILTGLVACGGVESGQAQEEMGQQSSALTCTANCPTGAITCQGASCSAVDGSHVQCGTVIQYCQPLICSKPTACENLNGKACSPSGSSRGCCLGGQPTGGCYCTVNGTWTCMQSPGDP
ncbi:hypothetical protein OV207_28155 [Corallococcus sp. BB11-1]|uniref:hypothetical protein n=1 Tax=Corallococcus sp. BB11-1 TaxID=2996783 RepID=UPI00226EDEEB|nr:hypothetical protein [Corallococcus sp. BB11-1]MCY1035352.1 hypothetical protein [Corallococcus sp. BB11-1]